MTAHHVRGQAIDCGAEPVACLGRASKFRLGFEPARDRFLDDVVSDLRIQLASDTIRTLPQPESGVVDEGRV
jgi:hypothetical protein